MANRVSHIQALTDVEIWDHVRSEDNPADLATRGLTPGELQQSRLWKHGPEWLERDPASWPRDARPEDPDKVNQELRSRARINTVISVPPEWDLMSRYSSLKKLVRVVAIMKLFVENCRKGSKRRRSRDWRQSQEDFHLTAAQQTAALRFLIRIVQNTIFPRNSKLYRTARKFLHALHCCIFAQ